MKAFTIVRNIYLKPREAFEKTLLDSTFYESMLWYVAVSSIGSLFIYPYTLARSGPVPDTWAGHHLGLIGILFTFVWIGIICGMARITRYFVRKQGSEVDLRPLIAGSLWIIFALYIPGVLLSLIPYRNISLILLPWQLWLEALCLHTLSGLDMKSSAWVIIKVSLLFIAVIFVFVTGPILVFIYLHRPGTV